MTTVATLDSITCNPDALVLDELEETIPNMNCLLFCIEKFIKQLQKGDKLNGIVLNKSTQKYMVTHEVGESNGALRVGLRTHHKFF